MSTQDAENKPQPIVELNDVCFAYDAGAFGLSIPCLTIAPGERVAFIGPSGSGKTTFIALMTGILRAQRGKVRLSGRDLSSASEAARRAWRRQRVGMVFQEFALLEALTAFDNIVLPYRLGWPGNVPASARERAHALAQATGIANVLTKRPARLSHGERQRVAICRSLVTKPDLIIGDEPTGNLDPERTASVLDLLIDQATDVKAALVIVTHDHSMLDRFDRVIDVGSYAKAKIT